MNIGEVAKKTGISAKMIRYYESVGLIPAARRTDAGYREYGSSDIKTFNFIRRLRELDFSVKQMEEMLVLWRSPSRSSADVKKLALEQSEALDRKARTLMEMSQTLKQLAMACHGDDQPECAILDGLSDELASV